MAEWKSNYWLGHGDDPNLPNRPRGLQPPQPAEPIIYHSLTTLGYGIEKGDREFLTLLNKGAKLAPSASEDPDLRQHWAQQAEASKMFERDRAAGDDQYIFMSIERPYALNFITVAFALEAFDNKKIAFRPHDLSAAYSEATHKLYMDDADDIETWRPYLSALAEYGTQTDPSRAKELTKLYWERKTTGRNVRALAERYTPLRSSKVFDYFDEADASILKHVAQKKIFWDDPFGSTASIHIASRPEFLVAEPVALSEAFAVRFPSEGTWVPIDTLIAQRILPFKGFARMKARAHNFLNENVISVVPKIFPDPWMIHRPELLEKLFQKEEQE